MRPHRISGSSAPRADRAHGRWGTALADHTIKSLLARLSRGGFRRDFVRSVVLPDWWDPSCEDDAGLIGEVELAVARFLGASIERVRTPAAPLDPPIYQDARLRKVRNIDQDRLAAAIHVGLKVSGAVGRVMRASGSPVQLPSVDPYSWRRDLIEEFGSVSLEALLTDLWRRGIPVVQLSCLPTPKYQGMAGIVDERPCVVIGHGNDEPARLALLVAHEACHIVSGDCEPNAPVVDEEEDVPDGSDMELRADAYAWAVLAGQPVPVEIEGENWRDVASHAERLGDELGIDPGVLVWGWTSRTADYATAQRALKALYLNRGGKLTLRTHFAANTDEELGSDTDRSLVRCVQGGESGGAIPR